MKCASCGNEAGEHHRIIAGYKICEYCGNEDIINFLERTVERIRTDYLSAENIIDDLRRELEGEEDGPGT